MKLFGTLLVAAALSTAALTAAFGMAPIPPAAASQPAMPGCCGDSCKKMGASRCKADDKSKVTCSMGGSCCLKPSTSTAPAASMPGMGGRKMGK